jgi:peptide deformylase
MTLPIHVYGSESLRQETPPITEDSDELQALIDDMIETMRGADGIGLAAPQVGRSERLFVLDLDPLREDIEAAGGTLPEQPMVLINPEIVWESEAVCEIEEGCLSLPEIREPVTRPERVRLSYLDRHFEERELEAGDMLARAVQHELDHLDGVLFTDHISAFRRRLLKRRLREMAEGEVEADYPLALPERA